MKIIYEIHFGHRSIFRVEEMIDNQTISKYDIDFRVLKANLNNTTELYLYDTEYNILLEPSQYVNNRYRNNSLNTRIRIMYDLRKLYIFSIIIKKQLTTWNHSDCQKFVSFLYGNDSRNGEDILYTFQDMNQKSLNSTLNNCKNYLKYNEFGCFKYFDNQKSKKTSNIYSSSPKSFSKHEIESIFNYLNNSPDISIESKLKFNLIIILMLNYGLRIGEVLGLTFEDFIVKNIADGDKLCLVVIRNRISDSIYQKAKRVISLNDFSQYNSKPYKTKDVGYQLINIDINHYKSIEKYMNESHDRLSKFKSYAKSKADQVNNNFGGENHYVFLNENNGNSLSYKVWSTTLRSILEAVGIKVDYDVKRNNTSHRFKHSFTTDLLYEKNIPTNIAIHYTRHASVKSLEPYTKLQDEMLIELFENIEEIYKKETNNDDSI